MLLALCVLLVLPALTGTPEENAADAGQPDAPVSAAANADRAEIVITPSTEVAYLDYLAFDSSTLGWEVLFTVENRSDIPFTIEKMVFCQYRGDELFFRIPLLYEDIRPHLHSDKLRNINDPFQWPVGTNQLYLTHVVCTVSGTDDNGNYIEVSTTVQYSQEYAPTVSEP